jgi:hypothetical protein
VAPDPEDAHTINSENVYVSVLDGSEIVAVVIAWVTFRNTIDIDRNILINMGKK